MVNLHAPFDVLVVGGGNAALCAAITARCAGARVLLVESAKKDFRGGNSRHTRDIRYMHRAATDWGPDLRVRLCLFSYQGTGGQILYFDIADFRRSYPVVNVRARPCGSRLEELFGITHCAKQREIGRNSILKAAPPSSRRAVLPVMPLSSFRFAVIRLGGTPIASRVCHQAQRFQ